MGKKIPEKVKEIQDFKLKQEAGSKSISFSQLSVYLNCPKCWERAYLRKEQVYQPSIHTCFGSAFHEVLQNWLGVLYNDTAKAADSCQLDQQLLDSIKTHYVVERAKIKQDFSDSATLTEFYEDGVAILDYIKKHRRALFPSNKTTWLVGCEIPIYTKLREKFFFKGFIDILTYEEDRGVWKIWDIKTSTRGWSAEKTDFVKTSQVLLYKEFLHRQFNIPLEKIEVEYFIVKRKIIEDAEFAAMRKRVQEFVPNDGPRIHKKVVGQVESFLAEALDIEGEYVDKDYPKNPSEKNCKWCLFKDTCRTHV